MACSSCCWWLLLGIFGDGASNAATFRYGAGSVDASIALYIVAVIIGAVGGQRPNKLASSRPARSKNSHLELTSCEGRSTIAAHA